MMDRFILVLLAGILSGFALIKVPLTDFLSSLEPFTTFIGVVAVLVFSLVLIYKGLLALFNR